MALVRFGGGITAMSGSIAGNTFARNRSGAYVRNRTKPVNPKSSLQNTARAIVSYVSEYWNEELTADQRSLWQSYANAVAMKNKLGETIKLSGFNHFVRTNAHRYRTGFAPLKAAPTTLALAEQDPAAACSEESIANQTFEMAFSDAGWGPDADDKIQICFYQGQPQNASRNFFAGPWRYMGKYVPSNGAVSPVTLDAVFAFALGHKVWFQARVLLKAGRLSEIWTLTPRIIVADV